MMRAARQLLHPICSYGIGFGVRSQVNLASARYTENIPDALQDPNKKLEPSRKNDCLGS